MWWVFFLPTLLWLISYLIYSLLTPKKVREIRSKINIIRKKIENIIKKINRLSKIADMLSSSVNENEKDALYKQNEIIEYLNDYLYKYFSVFYSLNYQIEKFYILEKKLNENNIEKNINYLKSKVQEIELKIKVIMNKIKSRIMYDKLQGIQTEVQEDIRRIKTGLLIKQSSNIISGLSPITDNYDYEKYDLNFTYVNIMESLEELNIQYEQFIEEKNIAK